MMQEKTLNIIKVIVIILLFIGTSIFKFIPEYKETQGSSDTYIDTKNYESIVEIKINEKVNFSLILSDSIITNILFFNESSLCLYNKDIESTSITDGTRRIVDELIENNYLTKYSTITLIKYNEKDYDKVKTELQKYTKESLLEVVYSEQTSSLEEKAKSLSLKGNDDQSYLKELELFSKEIIRVSKNDISHSTSSTSSINTLEEKTAKLYADSVYTKILNYATSNNIIDQDINSTLLPINLIPANNTGTIYPDSSSWYYIKDGKTYAYISITDNATIYSYCYQGSINEYKKGEC